MFEEKRELPVVEGHYVLFTPEADSLYAISADGYTYMLYVTDANQNAYSTSCYIYQTNVDGRCSYIPDLTSVPNLNIERGLAFTQGVTNSTIIIRKIL